MGSETVDERIEQALDFLRGSEDILRRKPRSERNKDLEYVAHRFDVSLDALVAAYDQMATLFPKKMP